MLAALSVFKHQEQVNDKQHKMGGAVQGVGAAAAEGHFTDHEGGDEQHHVGRGEAQAHFLPHQGADEEHGGYA